jgi:4-hydroxy-tetrahydrodipicolinate synthase
MPSLGAIEGVITALVTPFDVYGRIDKGVFRDLIAYQLAAGVRGVLVGGGSGEYLSLLPEERLQLVETAAEAASGRFPVIAGILEPGTAAARETARSLEEAGASALLVLTPYYFNPSADGIMAHFETVAGATSLPILLYNNPARTNLNLAAQLLRRLSEIENVVGIKECDRDIGRVSTKIEAVEDRLTFMAGDDDLLLPMLLVGARGGVMASPNLVPEWAVELLDAYADRDLSRCRDIQARIARLLNLFYGPNHPGPLKQALGHLGWPVGLPRLPLAPLDAKEVLELVRGLESLGLRPREAQGRASMRGAASPTRRS